MGAAAGAAGSRYVMDPKLQFGEMKEFWKQRVWWLTML